MKSVVVEIKDGLAAVLSEDGCIEKVKNKDYLIGQVIESKKEKIYISRRLAICAAACLTVLISGSVGVMAYTTPYSYVSLDVNPSIEYTLNRFDVVIDVTAVNDDGEAIIDEINVDNLDNQSIEDAIAKTVDQIAENGYFEGTTVTKAQEATPGYVSVVSGGGIVIATSSEDPDKSDELAEELQQAAENQVTKNGDTVQVEVISVALERVQQARELGVTPGKLNLVEKLKASVDDPNSIVLEEWLTKSVRDIMKATKDNKKATKANSDVVTDDTQKVIVKENEEQTTDSEVSGLTEVKEDSKTTKAVSKEAQKTMKESKKVVKKEQESTPKPEKEDKQSIDTLQKKKNNMEDSQEKKATSNTNADKTVKKNTSKITNKSDVVADKNTNKSDVVSDKNTNKSDVVADKNTNKSDIVADKNTNKSDAIVDKNTDKTENTANEADKLSGNDSDEIKSNNNGKSNK